jgi:hypothetical protein
LTGAPAILLPFVLALAAPQVTAAAVARAVTAVPSGFASVLPPAPATSAPGTSPTAEPPAAQPPTALPAPAGTPSSPGPPPSPQPPASPAGTSSPGAVPGPTGLPQSEPSLTVPESARPASSATPTPYGYRFVPHQPAHPLPGTPQIFAVWLNSRTLVSKGPIWIKVATDPETVKVTSSSGGHVGIVPMIAPGDFEAKSILPKFPFIAGGMTLDLIFTAVGPDGKHTTVSVPVGLK